MPLSQTFGGFEAQGWIWRRLRLCGEGQGGLESEEGGEGWKPFAY